MRNRPIQPLFLVAAGLLALGPHAWANTAGAGLPMEAPLQKLEQSFTGPIPYYGGIIGVVVTIIIMAFHGHTMGDFGKGVVITVMVVAFACAVPGALGTLGITGATVDGYDLFSPFLRLGSAATAMLWGGAWGCLWWRADRKHSNAQRSGAQGRQDPVGRN